MEKTGRSNLESWDNTVAKIQSSLKEATTLLSECNDVDHDQSSVLSSVDILGAAASDPCLSSPLSSSGPSCAATAGSFPAQKTMQFKCGRLKYSNVKKEWILRYQPLDTLSPRMDSPSRNHSLNSGRRNSSSVGQSQLTARIRFGRNMVQEEAAVGTDSMSQSKDWTATVRDTERMGFAEPQSPSRTRREVYASVPRPPIELVQCLLRCAEFISMMEKAKKHIKDGKGFKEMDQYIPLFVRQQSQPVNLSPFLLAALRVDENTYSEDNCIVFLDDCIKLAHVLSAEAAYSSFDEWEFQIAEGTLPSVSFHYQLSSPEKRGRRQKRAKASDLEDAKCCSETKPSEKYEISRTALDFVRRSLAVQLRSKGSNKKNSKVSSVYAVNLFPSWARKSNDDLTEERTEASVHLGKEGLPLAERSNRFLSTTGKRNSTLKLYEYSVQACGKIGTVGKTDETILGKSSHREFSWVVSDTTLNRGGSVSNKRKSTDSRSDRETADKLSGVDRMKNGCSGDDKGGVSILESHGQVTPSEYVSNSVASSRRSPRRKHFRWNTEWKSPLMSLAAPWQARGSRKEDSNAATHAPSVSSDDNTDGRSYREEEERAMSKGSEGDHDDEVIEEVQSETSTFASQDACCSSMQTVFTANECDVPERITPSPLLSPAVFHTVTANGKTVENSDDKDNQLVETRKSSRKICKRPPFREPDNDVEEASGLGKPRIKRTRLSPDASHKTKLQTKGRKWELWENLEFLRHLKIYGRGNWAAISAFISTRTNIQVKTHGQVLMRKLDEGIDIFEGLEEYVKDPAAFGRPSDQEILEMEASAAVIEKMPRSKTKKIQREEELVPKAVDRTKWTKLSHMGHISDYHGFGRKYEHFYPLKCGKSLREVQAEVMRTFLDSAESAGEEVDVDVLDEEESYLIASKVITARGKEERTKCKRKSGKERKMDDLDLPVLVEYPGLSILACDIVDSCIVDSSDSFGVSTGASKDLEHEADVKVPCFKYFDKDDEEVVFDESEAAGAGKKRPSRTAFISTQKQASIRLLSEMLHTCDFIEAYNNGFQKEQTDDSSLERDDEVSADCDQEESTAKSGKRESIFCTKVSKRTGVQPGTGGESPPVGFVPTFDRLSHAQHMKDYSFLMRQKCQVAQGSCEGDVGAAIQKIVSLLQRQSEDLRRIGGDESVVAEEKALNRGIRGYSRKADQEKMEKKEFAEKQQNLTRKYDFFMGKRKKVDCPHQNERKEVESRPFKFIRGDVKLQTDDAHTCSHGSSCLICIPVLYGELPYEKNEIFNPIFRRVEDQDRYIDEKVTNGQYDMATKNAGDRRALRDKLKLSSVLKLSELHAIFQFVAAYNEGMIDNTEYHFGASRR